MLKLKTLTIRNFLSFGNAPTEVKLDTGLRTLILGNNKDVGEDGVSRNGAGKSTMFQALVWCLFGDAIENVKVDGLVNRRNRKHLEVMLEFEVAGVEYTLIRTRKPNDIKLLSNGDDITEHGIGDVNKTIVELIGMDHELFLNTYCLSINSAPFMSLKPAQQRDFMERFLNLDVLSTRADTIKALRKESQTELSILERATEEQEASNNRIISLITKRKAELEQEEARLKELLGQFSVMEPETLDKAEREIDFLDKLLVIQNGEKDQNRLITESENAIEVIEREIEALQGAGDRLDSAKAEAAAWDEEKKEQLAAFEAELSEYDIDALNTELMDAVAYSSTKFEIETKEKQSLKVMDDIERHERDMKREQEKLDALLSGVCSECQQPYHNSNKEEELRAVLAGMEKEKEAALEEINQFAADIERLEKSLAADSPREESTIEATIKEAEKILDRIEQLEQRTNPHLDSIEKLTIEADTAADAIGNAMWRIEKVREVIEGAKEQLEDYQKERDAIRNECGLLKHTNEPIEPDYPAKMRRELEHHRSDIRRDNELRTQLANLNYKGLDEMSEQLVDIDTDEIEKLKETIEHQSLLVKLLTDNKSFIRKNLVDQYIPYVNQRINGYLERLGSPHVVALNADMSVDIEVNNIGTSYGLMSNGERLRLNLATNLAFRDMLMATGRGCNALFIDEYLDGSADLAFFTYAMGILNEESNSMFIISHRDDMEHMADEVMMVTKEDDFSELSIRSS